MHDNPKSAAVLLRVARRLRFQSFGRVFYLALLGFGIVYALVLLATRLSGLIPEWFHPLTLAFIPSAALVTALLVHRRPTVPEAARQIDVYQGTHDLFLTLSLLERSAGDYKPLVARDAERVAPTVKPVQVVPFRWESRAAKGCAILAGLLVIGLWAPQLDPFGRVEAAALVEKERELLAQSAKNTQLQIEKLAREREKNDGELSADVQKALDGLKLSLQQAKLGEKTENAKLLAENQKIIGSKWRNLDAQKLRELLSQASTDQQFGGADSQKLDNWARDLQQGSSEKLNEELNELKEALKELAREKDPVKKAELAQQLKKRMKAIEEFARKKAGSDPLAASIKRAMEQLETAKSEAMAKDALEAAQKSLDLAEMQLEQLAQSAEDLKALEEALKTMQMAKQLNAMDELDGERAEEGMTLEEYAAMYAIRLAELGGAPGNPGGGGAPVDEDESTDTDFKTQRSKSAVKAGKMLMSMKTKGLGDQSEAQQEYRELIDEVQQSVSEAIELEEVPPGYHKGIQSYFDSIDEPEPSPAEP